MILALIFFTQRCNNWSLISSISPSYGRKDSFNYPSLETLPKEEEDALSAYDKRDLVLREFPIKHIVASNPNSLVFSIDPPKGRSILLVLQSGEANKQSFFGMPFSTPLDLQQLLGLMWMMNMVFPRDRTSSCETFQTKDITLEEPEANPSFQDWEKSNYDLKLRMKLSAYREEI